jgi:CubicO group peptidase (beta-lactamase class C family)
MTHSFVADGEVHDEMVAGHTPWFGTKRPQPERGTHRSSAPQGGVVASARDLAVYMTVMLNGEDDILSADGKAEMMRPASDVSPWYGLGWFLDEDGTAWHSGSTPGIETLATMRPEARMGVVVLVNAGSGVGFGETAELLHGVTARALGTDYDGEGSRWRQKAMFCGLTAAPFVYLLSMFWAWRRRDAIRSKSGRTGMFSLWFPLFTTLCAAGFIFGLIPTLFGVSMDTLRRFQPDLALVLSATAVAGVVWAVFRLCVAHSGAPRH